MPLSMLIFSSLNLRFIRNTHSYRLLLFVLLLGGIALFSSCNDAPGPIGAELLPQDTLQLTTISSDTVQIITSTALGTVTPSLTSRINAPGTAWFLGASVLNTGEQISSRALVRFGIPIFSDSVRAALSDIQPEDILSADLILPINSFFFGDTVSRQLGVRVLDVRQPWYVLDAASPLNIPALLASPDVLFASSTLLGSALDSNALIFDPANPTAPPRYLINERVNRKTPVRITNKNVILRWLQADSAAWRNEFGIAIIPTGLSTTMRQLTEPVSIRIRIRRPTDTSDNVFVMREQFHLSQIRSSVRENSSLAVQAGAALRMKLNFNARLIPSLSTIHRAQFILNVDSARSTISTRGLPAQLYLQFPSQAALTGADSPFATTFSPTITGDLDSNVTDTQTQYFYAFRSNFSTLVERFVANPSNNTAILHFRDIEFTAGGSRPGDEEQDVTRIVFWGFNAPNPGLRPRITITYSRRLR